MKTYVIAEQCEFNLNSPEAHIIRRYFAYRYTWFDKIFGFARYGYIEDCGCCTTPEECENILRLKLETKKPTNIIKVLKI